MISPPCIANRPTENWNRTAGALINTPGCSSATRNCGSGSHTAIPQIWWGSQHHTPRSNGSAAMVKTDGCGSGCSRRDRFADLSHDLLAIKRMIPKLLKTSSLLRVCSTIVSRSIGFNCCGDHSAPRSDQWTVGRCRGATFSLECAPNSPA